MTSRLRMTKGQFSPQRSRIFPLMLAVTVTTALGTAHAQENAPGTLQVYELQAVPLLPQEASFQAGLPQAVDRQLLGEQRARAVPTLQMSDNNSQIDLQNNTVDGTHYGTNIVEQGAFEGARGISTVIQNTGHNVAIQESMNINLAINP